MAKIVQLCLLFILSYLSSINYVVGKGRSNGLTMRLIHRDSPESPFYQPHQTYAQRIERLVNQSKARIKRLNHSGIGTRILAEDDHTYMAQIGVGSFRNPTEPFKSYYLVMDTASDLTWLECSGCRLPGNHCFRETGEPYPDNTSLTYKKLLCNPPRGDRHILCDPHNCIGEFCAYQMSYIDDSSSKGFIATENFTFETNLGSGRHESVSDLVFGCGFDNKGMHFGHGSTIIGILALGLAPRSFVNQLGQKSLGRFSYCLQRSNQHNISTFLHFGDNIPRARAIYKTSFRKYKGQSAYFLLLEGITAAGTKLDIPENDFARKGSKGGCILDSGSAFSHIPPFAYEKLKQTLITHFANIRGLEMIQMPLHDLCYKRLGAKEGFRNLPTITFHLKNKTDLQFGPENSFFVDEFRDGKEYFCFVMYENEDHNPLTIIGAYQQANKRFVFLTKSNTLYFGPENCGHA